jgi:hypothetical protein
VEEAIQSLVFAPLRQNQFDALVSLVFNISPGQFKESEVLRALNAGDEIGSANGFDAWRRARLNGKLVVVDALVRRRAAEKALFLEHPGGRPIAPSHVLAPELDPVAAGGDREAAAGAVQRTSGPPAANAPQHAVDVRSAVEELAKGTPAARPPGEVKAEPVAGTAATADGAFATGVNPVQVKERLARILEKGERDQQARVSSPQGAAPESSLPEEGGSRTVRKLIDDTEIVDPGKDPDTLFAEGLKSAHLSRSRGGGLLLNGGVWRVAPWIGFLAMSIVGLAVTLSIALQDRTSEAPAAGPLAGTAVFAMLAVLSIYFIATRGPDRRT